MFKKKLINLTKQNNITGTQGINQGNSQINKLLNPN